MRIAILFLAMTAVTLSSTHGVSKWDTIVTFEASEIAATEPYYNIWGFYDDAGISRRFYTFLDTVPGWSDAYPVNAGNTFHIRIFDQNGNFSHTADTRYTRGSHDLFGGGVYVPYLVWDLDFDGVDELVTRCNSQPNDTSTFSASSIP